MTIVFRRKLHPDNTVTVKAVGIIEGSIKNIGTLTFPNAKTWSQFWGAIQRGALNVRELEVKLENATEDEETNNEPK